MPWPSKACRNVQEYLTDGYSSFPSRAPESAMPRVLAPGGLESDQFPFGAVARMATGR